MWDKSLASATCIITGTYKKCPVSRNEMKKQFPNDVRRCSSQTHTHTRKHRHSTAVPELPTQTGLCSYWAGEIMPFKQSAFLLARNICQITVLCCGRPQVTVAVRPLELRLPQLNCREYDEIAFVFVLTSRRSIAGVVKQNCFH